MLHVRISHRLFCAFFVLIAGASAVFAGALPALAASPPIEFDIADTNATAFLVAYAALAKTGVVVDGYFADRRIALKGRYANTDEVFGAVAAQLGATVSRQQGVRLLRHPCTPQTPTRLPTDLALNELISINSQSLRHPAELIRLTSQDVAGYTVSLHPELLRDAATGTAEIAGAMGIRLRDIDLKTFLELTIQLAGYEITDSAYRRFELRALARAPGCLKPPESLVSATKQVPKNDLKAVTKKSYLENFPVEDMRVMGRMVSGNLAMAVVQLNNGSVHWLKKGDFPVGQNYGKVRAIAAKGVTLIEIKQDAEDNWYEQKRFIRYRAPIDDSGLKPVPAAFAAQLRVEADAQLANGELRQAAQTYTKALAIEPNAIGALSSRLMVRTWLKDYAGAIADADRIVALGTKESIGYELRAAAKQSAGQRSGAHADWTKAIALENDPERLETLKRRRATILKESAQ